MAPRSIVLADETMTAPKIAGQSTYLVSSSGIRTVGPSLGENAIMKTSEKKERGKE
jgi:hypothetical protein